MVFDLLLQKSVGIGKYRPMFEKSVGIEKYQPMFDVIISMSYLDSTFQKHFICTLNTLQSQIELAKIRFKDICCKFLLFRLKEAIPKLVQSKDSFRKTTFAKLQCEYRESGSEVSVNTDLVPRNWGPIPTSGLRPSVGIEPQFLWTSVCIYRYLLSRLTLFSQAVSPKKTGPWNGHSSVIFPV